MPINYKKTYENLDYDERMELRDLSIKAIREIYPDYIVQPLNPNDPDIIFIRNQQNNVRVKMGLRLIYVRFVDTARTKNDLKDIIYDHFAPMLKMVEDVELIKDHSNLTLAEAKDRLYPRLARKDEFPNVEDIVSFPFGEDLVTAFFYDDPDEEGLLTRVSREMCDRWEISDQELYKIAMKNFMERMPALDLVGTEPPHGYLRTDSSDEYTATAILIGDFRYTVAQTIGTPFRFGVPSRYLIIAWSELDDEEYQIEMRAWMKREFDRLPSRLTEKIYEVNDKGEVSQLKNLPELPTIPRTSNN